LNEPDRTTTWPVGIGDDLPERLWPEGDFQPPDDSTLVDPTARLVTLSFIRAALKRRRRLWCTLAVVGLILGVGVYKFSPPSYSASTTILLTDGPNEDPQVQISADAALAKSTQVGATVVQKLGLSQSVASFIAAYSVAAPADLVLTITMTAPTSVDAVQRADAVATAFLNTRAQFARTQEQQLEAGLSAQISQAQQHLNAINTQITQLSSSSTASQSKLAALQAQKTQAANNVAQVQVDVTGTELSARSGTASMIQDTRVINQATLASHSRIKTGGIYVVGGLMGGLVIGIGIVLLDALLSDRLRRRDDVAYALGVPVRLSVGPLRKGRLPSPRGEKNRDRDMTRVVEYLSHEVPASASSRGPSGLAVVAVDDPQTVAEAVVSLARSCAAQNKRVILADLSAGKSAARMIGTAEPGMRKINSEGTTMMVFIPEDDDVMPVGPLRSGRAASGLGKPSEAVLASVSAADVILVLATLDPAFGAEHLATWATAAVTVVTCGKSDAAAIRSAGEMVRIAGISLDSSVLIGADQGDESLGAWSS
jgi:capsular polysaccharide biosynthesis protein